MTRGAKRTNKALVEKWNHVRIEHHRNGYRVREYDRTKKDTVDRGYFADLERARELAKSIAYKSAVASPAQADTATIAILGAKVLEPSRYPNWGENHRANQTSIFRTHIVPKVGELLARDAQATDFGALLVEMKNLGMSQSTIGKVLKFLRLIAREAIAAGIWNSARHPITDLKAPLASGKGEQLQTITTSEIPTAQQVKELRKHLELQGTQFAIMCDIAAYCGLRWGELLALRRRDIDLRSRTISVMHQIREVPKGFEETAPKTEAGIRKVVIPKVIQPALSAFLKGREQDQFLFLSSAGTHIRRSNWASFLGGKRSKLGDTTGVYQEANWPSHLTWHSLRHFAATFWLQSGVSIVDVSEMLGHADTSITMRIYVGSDKEAHKRARNVL